MMPSLQSQAVKLEISLKTFEANLEFMVDEIEEEREKIVLAGASAYATSAQKHTPPNLGKPDIDPSFYEPVESDHVLMNGERAAGRRVIYNLRQIVRNPLKARWKKLFGHYLQQGFEYAVTMKNRNGKKLYLKPCRTISDARAAAVESYRGLMRSAWGISFDTMGRKTPPAFKKYLNRRPDILKRRMLSSSRFEKSVMTVEITNDVIPNDAGFIQSTDVNASIAAVKTMDDMMTRYFKKKFDL